MRIIRENPLPRIRPRCRPRVMIHKIHLLRFGQSHLPSFRERTESRVEMGWMDPCRLPGVVVGVILSTFRVEVAFPTNWKRRVMMIRVIRRIIRTRSIPCCRSFVMVFIVNLPRGSVSNFPSIRKGFFVFGRTSVCDRCYCELVRHTRPSSYWYLFQFRGTPLLRLFKSMLVRRHGESGCGRRGGLKTVPNLVRKYLFQIRFVLRGGEDRFGELRELDDRGKGVQ